VDKNDMSHHTRLLLAVLAALPLSFAASAAPGAEPTTKTFTYKTIPGGTLEMVVHYPPGWKDTDKRPAIVFFFGGGWDNGTIEQFEPQADHLARRGMVAARADYRVKSRHGVAPDKCVEDAKSAVRWLRANAAKLGINPDRIVASGGSSGGHIAACTALTEGLDLEAEDRSISSKPNALVLFNPVLRFHGASRLMSRINNDVALGDLLSPTLHVTKKTPPTLVLFGTSDFLMAQGEEFMQRAKEAGCRAELFTAENEPHGFFNRPPWRDRTIARMDEFLVSLNYLEPASAAGSGTPLTFERSESRLLTKIDGKPFGTYVWSDPAIKRPFFEHLQSPGGVQLTRNHPPVEGKDATDHDTFHPGVWISFGDLSGADFWRNKAVVRQIEFVEEPVTEPHGGRLAVRNSYEAGGKTICEEVCRIRLHVSPRGNLILWESSFLGADAFTFGDQEEMGLGVRMATGLTVNDGGVITNSDGLVNEKDVWGKQADWCDYSAKGVGIMLMPDPRNFRRSWFHARDYGLLVANPFGRQAFTKGEPSRVVVEKGSTLTLKFGVLFHDGDLDRPGAYKEFLSAVK
jgi:acetyl esterase/lipase